MNSTQLLKHLIGFNKHISISTYQLQTNKTKQWSNRLHLQWACIYLSYNRTHPLAALPLGRYGKMIPVGCLGNIILCWVLNFKLLLTQLLQLITIKYIHYYYSATGGNKTQQERHRLYLLFVCLLYKRSWWGPLRRKVIYWCFGMVTKPQVPKHQYVTSWEWDSNILKRPYWVDFEKSHM